jgi:COX assembly mitochondrial protein 2
MHPPLDRPHPDCQDEILKLKECHGHWTKYVGACNDIKFALDACFAKEKKRLLKEMESSNTAIRESQEAFIQQAFGRKESFAEYLAKDKGFQEELKKKQEREQSAAAL